MRIIPFRRPALLAGLIAVVAVAAAGAAAGGTHAKRGAVVELRSTGLGKVLVDARGLTLYLYTPDRKNLSNCYGQCASFWPPLLTAGKPRAAAGVKASLLGTTKRKDGRLQVTYAGHPLYRFAQDRKAGQTNGQGYQGIWYVLSSKGAKVTKTASAQSSNASQTGASTTPANSGGYSYGGGY